MVANLAGVGEPARYFKILMHIVEARNDSGMKFLKCSVPRAVTEANARHFRSQRRSDAASTACFAIGDGDVICHNVVRPATPSDGDSDEDVDSIGNDVGIPAQQRRKSDAEVPSQQNHMGPNTATRHGSRSNNPPSRAVTTRLPTRQCAKSAMGGKRRETA